MSNFGEMSRTPEEAPQDILGPQIADLLERWAQLSVPDREQFTFLEFARHSGIEINPAQVDEFNRTMSRAAERIELLDWIRSLSDRNPPPDAVGEQDR